MFRHLSSIYDILKVTRNLLKTHSFGSFMVRVLHKMNGPKRIVSRGKSLYKKIDNFMSYSILVIFIILIVKWVSYVNVQYIVKSIRFV